MKTIKVNEIDRIFEESGIPHVHLGFYPTPFHKLNRLSRKYGVNIYFKREDLSGPSNFGGNKIRKCEYLLGDALKNGVDYVLTEGGYQSNSAMELAASCRIVGITPELFLYDVLLQGDVTEYRGNLMLDQIMGVKVHYIPRSADEPNDGIEFHGKIHKAMHDRKAELEAQGHKVLIVPAGCACEADFVSHVHNFKEIMLQSERLGFIPDYIYNTTGTGGTLPGLMAGKLMTGAATKIRRISIQTYNPGDMVDYDVIVNRVKHVFNELKLEAPADDVIKAELDVDQGWIGPDYGIPYEESTAAIKEVASCDGIFLDPVYTGKGFAGVLSHIHSGKIPQGSNVVFVHTGGTGALFAERKMVGALQMQ